MADDHGLEFLDSDDLVSWWATHSDTSIGNNITDSRLICDELFGADDMSATLFETESFTKENFDGGLHSESTKTPCKPRKRKQYNMEELEGRISAIQKGV